ncbi:MAG: hypothetical protein WCD89_00115 [Anaerocolumna sp.]
MIIDIDIKIADSDGKMIHRFSKKFDEKLEVSEKINKDSGISKGFEEFLSEYLSVSGRSIREKLISNQDTVAFDEYNTESDAGDDNLYETSDGITDSEVEYKIRIGSKKVFVGKIPFQVMNRINAVTDALYQAENKERVKTDTTALPRQTDDADMNIKNHFDFTNKETVVDLDKNISTIMLQAVEKYESSFYHMDEDAQAIQQGTTDKMSLL